MSASAVQIAKGAPIFRLDSSKQEAAVETARRKIAEVEAELVVARTDILKADGQIQEAKSAHQQAVDELETKQELQRRNPGNVAFREIERLQVVVEGRLGAIAAATAAKQAAEERISTLLPAQKASAEAALAQAQVDLDKDGHPCRRERASGAVRAAGGRYRQSDHASGRDPDPG